MILKVDKDLDNPIFNISSMTYRAFSDSENPLIDDTTMIFGFNPFDVRCVYSKHDFMHSEPEFVKLMFDNDTELLVYFNYHSDIMKYPKKLIEAVYKEKMIETKWAKDNPQKYI